MPGCVIRITQGILANWPLVLEILCYEGTHDRGDFTSNDENPVISKVVDEIAKVRPDVKTRQTDNRVVTGYMIFVAVLILFLFIALARSC